MPNELAIKLSFIADILSDFLDYNNMGNETIGHIIAAQNSLYEAEQSITSMVN